MTGGLPPEPSNGENTLDWARRLVRWLRGITPKPGAGTRLSRTSSGTSISADTRRRPKPFPDPYRMPLDVYIDDTGDDPVIKVVPGQVNRQDPTQIGTSSEWTYAGEAGEVFLKAVLEKSTGKLIAGGGGTNPVELHFDDEVPEDSENSLTITTYLPLATIDGTGEDDDPLVVTTHYNGSRWVSLALVEVECETDGFEKAYVVRW